MTRLPIATFALLRRTATALKSRRGPPPLELTGTFDFKWPLGSKIRVAVQRLPEGYSLIPKPQDNLEAAIDRLRQAFLAWGVRDPSHDEPQQLSDGVPPPELTYTILTDYWPAPARERAMRFLTPESVNEMSQPMRDYDLLVSFSPLPITLPRTQYYDREDSLLMPQSELGTYARRLDLGLPSMYIGPVASDDLVSWEEWLNSDQAKFVFRHEVGHALGLAHEHQNPKRALEWCHDVRVKENVMRRHVPPFGSDNGLEDKKTYLEIEMSPWPEGKGPSRDGFSEWRTPDSAEAPEFNSVMVTPFYRCLLPPTSCPDLFVSPEALKRHQLSLYEGLDVSDEDRAQLSRMYQYPSPPPVAGY